MSTGRRQATDQHEIVDFIHTAETDQQARRIAKRTARQAVARERRQRRTAVKTSTAAVRRRVALTAAAVLTIGPAVAGVWLSATDFTFDSAARADRAACKEFDAASKPSDTSAGSATSAAARLRAIAGRDTVSPEVSEALTSTASAYEYAARVYGFASQGPAVEAAGRVVRERHNEAVAACEGR